MSEKQVSILVVEDDAIVAKDLQKSLEHFDYDVTATVSTGEDAVAEVDKKRPDMILMDIMLAGAMDGIETAQTILKKESIPIVYLTAYADDATVERAKATAPSGYIIKPFEELALRTTVEMAVQKARIESGIRESERMYRTLVEMSPDAIIHTDLAGNLITVNRKCAELFGFATVERMLQTVEDPFSLIDPDDREEGRKNMEKTLRAGGLTNQEYRLQRQDGTHFEADISSSVITDENANPKAFIIIIRDSTQRKKIEAELSKTQRLESLGMLAGGIAHDFNNMLGSLYGYIDLAKECLEPECRAARFLDKAMSAYSGTRDLTKQLLSFAKGGRPMTKVMVIDPVIKKAVTFVLAGSNIRRSFHFALDLYPVEIDEEQIIQVINNLVINARHAMPRKGSIQVNAVNKIITKEQNLPIEEGHYIEISVIDQGTGIPQEHLPKIFDPFFTTKQQGSGIGLATCFSIIKNHKGHITVESGVGEGTTMRIYLPASKRSVIAEKEAVSGEPGHGHGRILVMDDDELMRSVAGDMLQRRGYNVHLTREGKQAVDEYKRAYNAKEPYRAVILDLTVVGGMGGEEALQKLLEIDPEVKAVVTSGYTNSDVLAKPAEYGFSASVEKPYRIRELVSAVQKAVLGW